LQTFAGEAGLVRRDWGSASYAYGKVAGGGIYRRGLTQKFTIEGSAEGTPGALMGGAGGAAQIANLGVVNFAGAMSTGSGHAGAELSAGAQRIGRMFSVGGSAIIANRGFRDVAAMNGDGVPRKQLSAFASVSTRHFGSAGVAYGELAQDAAPVAVPGSIATAEHTRVLSANYSLQLRRVSIYATEFKDFSSTSNSSNGVQFGLTIPFGRRSSVNLSATSDGQGQVEVQKSAPQIGDWGYEAYYSGGDGNHEFGQVQYKSPVGLFTAGVDSDEGQTTFRLESQGAVSFVDRGFFPSNTIYDSFAVVDTSPIAHVHVQQENRDVGTTGSSCRLLVPDMRAFDLNHIKIEATDIPPDATIQEVSRKVRPQDRSGVVVRFPIKFSNGALLQLVDEAGAALPLGSTATLRGTSTVVPIGYDGDTYVEGLSAHNELAVERADGRRCTVTFDFKPAPGSIPSIGPLRCREAGR
jgi:outer membrane usher protein